MKSLVESLFDDNLVEKHPPLPCGLEIDPVVWDECKKYAEKRIKTFYSKYEIGDHDALGDNALDYVLCYKDKDTIVFLSAEAPDMRDIYIMCPESVYFHLHFTNEDEPVHLDNVRMANDYSIHFLYNLGEYWGRPCWWYDLDNDRRRIDYYMPVTIDPKAKRVIEKLIKDEKYRESILKK